MDHDAATGRDDVLVPVDVGSVSDLLDESLRHRGENDGRLVRTSGAAPDVTDKGKGALRT